MVVARRFRFLVVPSKVANAGCARPAVERRMHPMLGDWLRYELSDLQSANTLSRTCTGRSPAGTAGKISTRRLLRSHSNVERILHVIRFARRGSQGARILEAPVREAPLWRGAFFWAKVVRLKTPSKCSAPGTPTAANIQQSSR
jgi:hypothetical protein